MLFLNYLNMKQYILYLIIGIMAMFVSSCENVDIEPYQNRPTIESAQCAVESYTLFDVTLNISVTLDSYLGNYVYVRVELSNGRTENMRFSCSGGKVYSRNYNVSYDRFDSLDCDNGIVKLDALDVSICTDNGDIISTNTYRKDNLSFEIAKPSIQILDVEKTKTEYDSDDKRYHTFYDVKYKITGAGFLKEAYFYLIGNWATPGKGNKIYKYEGVTTDTWSVNYDYSSSGKIYAQFRAMTKSGVELIADKTICLEGTGKGDKNIYLVNSSSVYSTRGLDSGFDNTEAADECCDVFSQESKTQVENIEFSILH